MKNYFVIKFNLECEFNFRECLYNDLDIIKFAIIL
jgi:hypothetical protein